MNQEKLSSLALNNLHRDRVIMLYEHIREGTLSYYVWSASILTILVLSGVDVIEVVCLGLLLVGVQVIKSRYMRKFFALPSVENPILWERYMMLHIVIHKATKHVLSLEAAKTS